MLTFCHRCPATPVKNKESTKKMLAKLSTSSAEEIQQLDAKWSEHLSHLEAMVLVRSFQPPTSKPTFQHFTMPVPPKIVGTLTSDRPFIQPRPFSQTSS